MPKSKLFSVISSIALLFGTAFAIPGFAASQGSNLIRTPIDEGHLVSLGHTTHPAARPEADLGVAPDALPMNRMLLVLKRSPERQAALDQFLNELQQPLSPNYHKFLTPQEFGDQFGASDTDVQIVTSWLQSHGFKVQPAEAGRGIIEFSGNAGQVRSAFHTEIHKFNVAGSEHWANVGNQQIPAAVASAVVGVSTLHNFKVAPQSFFADHKVPLVQSQANLGGGHYLSPGDLATIYNINPIYPAITGAGTTIAVVARSNINIQDVITFRSLTGLPANPPNIILNGPDPGIRVGNEEAEAVLDATWAGALATGATVDLVVSSSTLTTDGVDLSEVYIINHNLGNVMTESFGACETDFSPAQLSLISSNAQQAAAQGISYTVSTGDSGSAGCDYGTATATHPPSVNALASSPYTIAVGGTQFFENGSSQYWNPTNSATFSSALSYIPEDVWNDNCTGATCGTGSILSTGGGASSFFAKPSWQTGVAGIPNDGVRDLPDVSLTAAGHDAYLICFEGSCDSATPSFAGIYGTSASTPAFASIIALLNQKVGTRLGQLTPRLYSLAAAESLSSCNGSNTAGLPASNCIFNDVTVGTNAVPGEPNYNTALETYPATVGYDLATGLGSVNVANLVNNWSTAVTAPTAGLSPSALTFASQTIGLSSAAQKATLTNSGTAALSISGVTITGANASDFSIANACGASLAASSSCAISVVFKPTAAGTRTATLVVTDNTGNVSGSTQTVSLSGTGTSAVTPTTFTTYLGTYGSAQPAYSGASQILPLRGYLPTGASQMTYFETVLKAISGGATEYTVYVTNNGAGGFTLSLNNGTTNAPAWPYPTLSASGTTVTLSTPITLGSLSITAYRFALVGNEMQLDLTVTRTGTFSDQIVVVGISGTSYSSPWYGVDGTWSSTAASAPAVTLSPTSLNFGSQSVGTSVTQKVTVTNSGTAPLTVSSATVSGTNSADFIVTNGCTSSVAAGGTCAISVAFNPASVGARAAMLSIADNATGSPQTVPLSGTGTSSATPTTFTTYLGAYGSAQPAYSGASQVLPLRGYLPTGASQMTYFETVLKAVSGGATEYTVYVISNGAGGFTLSLNNGTSNAPAWPYPTMSASGSTVTLSTPITLGTLSITAYRFALAGNEMQLDLTVTRTGTFNDQIIVIGISGNTYSSPWYGVDGTWSSNAASAPAVTLSPTSLNFGSQSLGTSVTQKVTVTNSGTAALAISSATVSGTNASDFTITNGCTSSVAAGGSCAISVAFYPGSTGSRTATLSIADNATGSPQTVPLSGTGTASATPTTFTTYLGTYGSAQPAYSGASQVLPLRGYLPTGASQMTYFETVLRAVSSGATEYTVYVVNNTAGGFELSLSNGTTSVPAWPHPVMSPSGATVTLSTPITLGTLSITAYRFALVGNEMQLDLTVTRTGTFNDQIVIVGISGNTYSSPWYGVDGTWSN